MRDEDGAVRARLLVDGEAADDGRAAVPLGLCMMYNHHPTHPNVGHELDATDAQYMRVVALRDLRCGQELFTHYGDAYWEARGIQPVVPP